MFLLTTFVKLIKGISMLKKSALKHKINLINNRIDSLFKPSIILIICLAGFVIITMDLWRNWHSNQHQINWDIANYYSYLPAFFDNDGSFEFKSDLFENNYLPKNLINGKHLPKTTYGLSVLYAPLYGLGYKIAINQNNDLNGFSEPFFTVLHWGTIFYAFLGILVLRFFLIKYFSEIVTTITIAILFLGSTLFFYSVSWPEMPHGLLFLLFSCFLLFSAKWHESPNLKYSLIIGGLIGLITLIRPTDIIIVLLFVFWPNSKIHLLLKTKWKYFIVMGLVCFTLWIPQLIFWHDRTGQWLYFSYPGEQFFWNDPQLINVLFSYRKGFFVYSPLIFLCFIGFFFLKDKLKPFKIILLLITIINIYIISCWWDWFFGGSFGARAFVQHFSYLSIPLAAFVSFIFESSKKLIFSPLLKLTVIIIITFGISLNLFQTYQYVNFIIHFNGMSKETYWLVFGKSKLNEFEQNEFWRTLKNPDYDKLRTGEDRDQ